jgi:GxxExxY protein
MGHAEFLIPALVVGIADACRTVRAHCPFGGREATFQAMLEVEARMRGYMTRREVVCGVSYRGVPLGNNTSMREDLVIFTPLDTVVVELKATKKLEYRDFQQLCRYLGDHQHGLLVCFGETHDEAWYVRIECGAMLRTRVLSEDVPQSPMHTYETFGINGSV